MEKKQYEYPELLIINFGTEQIMDGDPDPLSNPDEYEADKIK